MRSGINLIWCVLGMNFDYHVHHVNVKNLILKLRKAYKF